MLVDKVYDSLAPRYDARYKTPQALLEDEAVFGLLKRHVRTPVLDLGCGTGLFLDHMPMHHDQYQGVDISPQMLEQLMVKHPTAEAMLGDVNTMPLDGYNTVVSLYGSASYILPVKYQQVVDSPVFFLMVYKPGYLPDYYPSNQTTVDYDLFEQTFPHVYEWHNFLIAGSMTEELS